MKKILSITFTALGAAVAVIGAGVLGGTYGSYSNYQALATGYNFAKNEAGSNSNSLPSFASVVSNWNDQQAKLSADQKKQNNQLNEANKEQFYKKYPTYDDFKKNYSSTGMTDQQIQDYYNSLVASYSMDYNYSADQSGVIAGSVLLAIGLVAFIAFLVITLKKKKA